MNTPLTHRQDVNGATAEVPADPGDAGAADRYPLPITWRGIGAQSTAALRDADRAVLLLRAILALVIAVVGTRPSHRLPASAPERTRRGRGAGGRPDPAGQS